MISGKVFVITFLVSAGFATKSSLHIYQEGFFTPAIIMAGVAFAFLVAGVYSLFNECRKEYDKGLEDSNAFASQFDRHINNHR